MGDSARQLKTKIDAARPFLESALGFAIWTNAPVALTGAVQRALDALNEAAFKAERIEREKENQTMKNLFAMLDAFNAVENKVLATTERIAKAGTACDKMNAQLDAFFAAVGLGEAETQTAEAEAVAEAEAAPNGELGDGAENAGVAKEL